MKRHVYYDPLPPNESPAEEARQQRRANNYRKRSDMAPDELERVRKANCERQKAYLKRRRIAKGLPPVGKPGRPRKAV